MLLRVRNRIEWKDRILHVGLGHGTTSRASGASDGWSVVRTRLINHSRSLLACQVAHLAFAEDEQGCSCSAGKTHSNREADAVACNLRYLPSLVRLEALIWQDDITMFPANSRVVFRHAGY